MTIPAEHDYPVRCKCGRCTHAVVDILQRELDLCSGARRELTRRRKLVRAIIRRAQYRDAKRRAARSA